MLKKIATADLQPGMYVQQLCGRWLDHPFWKKHFLVDAKALSQLRGSGVKELWIDTAKGADVVEAVEPDPTDTLVEADHEAASEDDAETMEPQACSLAEELSRASRIVAEARGAMKAMFEDVRLGQAIHAEHCMPLVNDITASVKRNPGAIVSLARLKTSDDYTYMHSVAVCALMVSLARQLELSEADTREAGLAGLVHDIGKAQMPLDVLNKHGKLTDTEYAIMKTHPEVGHQMLMEAKGVGEGAMDVALHHHEKIDGSGYPHGLAGDAIPLLARMGAVCDVYDAITSQRPYKMPWDPAASIQKMAQWSREGHFDDTVFQAFVRAMGIYPIGSLVRLRSAQLAVIVDRARGTLLKPTIKAFYDISARKRFEPRLIELAARDCDEEIVAREDPTAWGLDGLDDLWRLPAKEPETT
jgi:putative nucleotidyltransferase with HDIG domain